MRKVEEENGDSGNELENNDDQAISETENDSACYECGGGGVLICCDTCTRAFHQECLPPPSYPSKKHNDWVCPVCSYLPFRALHEKRQLSFHARVSEDDEDPYSVAASTKSPPARSDAVTYSYVTDSTSVVRGETEAPSEMPMDTLPEEDEQGDLMEGEGGVMDEGGNQPRKSARVAGQSRPRISAIMSSDKHLPQKTRTTQKVELDMMANKLNVGARHQPPFVPKHFLEIEEVGASYYGKYEADSPTSSNDTRHGVFRLNRTQNKCCLVYSPTLWAIALEESRELQRFERESQTSGDVPDEDDFERGVVTNGEQLETFLKNCEALWSPANPWPFSNEYAFKLLHFCRFNRKLALTLLEEQRFSLSDICDMPRRPYMNKWRPKDRRGHIPSTPFPPNNFLASSGQRPPTNGRGGARG